MEKEKFLKDVANNVTFEFLKNGKAAKNKAFAKLRDLCKKKKKTR